MHEELLEWFGGFTIRVEKSCVRNDIRNDIREEHKRSSRCADFSASKSTGRKALETGKKLRGRASAM